MSLRGYLLAFAAVLILHYLPVFTRSLPVDLFTYWSVLSLAWLILTIVYLKRVG
ncbi:hypothetical protein Pyrfu_0393 [Pyrolobus fumarii 1A]|uniref:Uncharacterized protein n=1 Tax=Pyrolobus fumarii (strain DSM 11204 / 1A) TaxID=694429 RepID=G0EG17_PYRF1|nr:hypothetical protein [Pyrolobus fumarii]AEM38265.1 hypothetical protein Pyrfu_0393 [Pyrolobus fumarii 1A]